MKKCVAIVAVALGVVGLCVATCCLPCGTTSLPPAPEPPPPAVSTPADAAPPAWSDDDAEACEARDAAAAPLPVARTCVPQKDIHALCAAVRPLCGPN